MQRAEGEPEGATNAVGSHDGHVHREQPGEGEPNLKGRKRHEIKGFLSGGERLSTSVHDEMKASWMPQGFCTIIEQLRNCCRVS